MNQAPFNNTFKDKFTIVLTLPDIIKKIDDEDIRNTNFLNTESLEFSVFGTVTPPIGVPKIEVPYGGRTHKISSHAKENFDDVTLDFVIDNEFKNYWCVYKWLDMMSDVELGHYNADDIITVNGFAYPKSYTSTFSLYGMDEYENRKIRFDYIGCFPTRLDGIDWSYSDESRINSKVTFAFTNMKVRLI